MRAPPRKHSPSLPPNNLFQISHINIAILLVILGVLQGVSLGIVLGIRFKVGFVVVLTGTKGELVDVVSNEVDGAEKNEGGRDGRVVKVSLSVKGACW